MSEYERTPEMPDLSGIYIIPAGKAGRSAKKRFANERKARMKKIHRLSENESSAGLLVMLTASDQRLCRYIMKKLGQVIPFFVRTHADRNSSAAAREMSRLLCRCEEMGMRTLWLDLAGTEKLDKKQVLYLVAGELIRVLEAPAPERAEPAQEEPVKAVEQFEQEERANGVEAVDEDLPSVEDVAAPPGEKVDEDKVVGEAEFVEKTAPAETIPEKAADEETPAPKRRRTRKASSKAEGETQAKPRKKRQPRGPLTVEEMLARRRRQMGLEE